MCTGGLFILKFFTCTLILFIFTHLITTEITSLISHLRKKHFKIEDYTLLINDVKTDTC